MYRSYTLTEIELINTTDYSHVKRIILPCYVYFSYHLPVRYGYKLYNCTTNVRQMQTEQTNRETTKRMTALRQISPSTLALSRYDDITGSFFSHRLIKDTERHNGYGCGNSFGLDSAQFGRVHQNKMSKWSGIEREITCTCLNDTCVYDTMLCSNRPSRCIIWYGNIQGYDEHLNMVLGDVEERTYPAEQGQKPTIRRFDMLFLRGDVIVLVAPPPRTT